MKTIRAFIAVELPAEIQTEIKKIQNYLSVPGSRAVRWVSPLNIHLTLKFLGEIPDLSVRDITTSLASRLISVPPFIIAVAGLGAFPNLFRPRVLWVGVQQSQELNRLQSIIDDCLLTLKFPKEERAFHPHLTLGRVSDQAQTDEVIKVTNLMKESKIGALGEIRVDRVQLIRSDLRPAGPIYTSIHLWHLS
jgi:RNA 2',3'-cyclic 3'-phosphodiesterase